MSGEHPTILVLHPSSTDPTAFLHRLASSPDTTNNQAIPRPDTDHEEDQSGPSRNSTYTSATIPWDIENKYYTASVNFKAYPQEIYDISQAKDVEVIMYLFEGTVNSLPPVLVKVMAEPRDIALSIRLKSASIRSDTGYANQKGSRSTGEEEEQDGLEDMFDEIGMEYLDEASLPEDDDERPISIEERIRQTLMTHMWPNMVRKPLSTPSRGLDLDWDDGDEVLGGNGEIASAEFSVSFDPSSNNGLATTDEAGETNDFPGLDELKSQIMLEDLEQRNNPSGGGDRLGFSRLDMMDDEDLDFDDMGRGGGDGGDWVEAEYAKLDDWLEEDEGEGEGEGAGENDGEGTNTHTLEHDDHDMHESNEIENSEIQPESQFEDDFADFAPFQSAPPPLGTGSGSASASASASLDPTPLLLHLQNVREELAGMDEDTRRVRAGREVESVLKSLGLGGLDWEHDEFDDMDPRVGETRRNEIG